MDMIRIKTADTGITHGTQVFASDGTEIKGVSNIKISLAPNDFARAEIEMVTHDLDMLACPMLGLETVKAAAEHHGYRLVKQDESEVATEKGNNMRVQE